MKNQDQLVLDEMRNLIRKSCAAIGDNVPKDVYQFHKALLKFFFSIADVTIDYDQEEITLWKSEPGDSRAIFQLSEAIGAKVSYTNLEETLKGCLEREERAIRFYRTMLFHYNKVDTQVENAFMSA